MKLTERQIADVERLNVALVNAARACGECYLSAIKEFASNFDRQWSLWLETPDGRAYQDSVRRLRVALESAS